MQRRTLCELVESSVHCIRDVASPRIIGHSPLARSSLSWPEALLTTKHMAPRHPFLVLGTGSADAAIGSSEKPMQKDGDYRTRHQAAHG